MSKNIVIQEGGVGKQLTADKLRTNLVGGGTCLWVPEDEVQLTTKTITENGTYKASDDGYYGYSEVVVNIANAGTATGTDGDGDEAVAYQDPETGELVEEKVPSSIAVITPPTNPYGIYTNGQTITKDGMVVKAYLQTGGEYGTVPNGEITLDPTTAVYDPATDVPAGGTATSDLETSLPQPIAFSNSATAIRHREYDDYITTLSGDATYYKKTSATYIQAVALSKTSDGIHLYFNGDEGTVSPTSFTINGKTVYRVGYGISGNEFSGTDYTGKTVDQNSEWAMVWGDIEETRAGSRQQITVSWPRPIDGKVLETTFEILVAPPYSSGEE